jgi:DNA polymerase-3 subunit epsilon
MMGPLVQYTSRMLGLQAADGKDAKADTSGAEQPRSLDENAPLEELDYVVFDTELTGLKARRDAIVSIGAVRMRGERIQLGPTFYRLIDPKTAFSPKSVVIHEITPTEAAGSPGIDALLPEFLEFCGDAVIVGHVVSIDLQFINREMKQRYGRPIRNHAVDTYKLYRWLREKEENHCAFHGGTPESVDLFSLAKKYGIPVQHAHNALSDAFITAQLFQRMLRELPRWGVAKLSDLLRIGKP